MGCGIQSRNKLAGICIQRFGPNMGARASFTPFGAARPTKAPRRGDNCFRIRSADSTHPKRSIKVGASAFWVLCGRGRAGAAAGEADLRDLYRDREIQKAKAAERDPAARLN